MVKSELDKLSVRYSLIELGEVEIVGGLPDKKRLQLKEALANSGLMLMDDKKAVLIERIKNVIVEMIHYSDELPLTNFSEYLSGKLNQDYSQLSTIFSQTKGVTIEHFIMQHKIEKVKELLIYGELNLTQIAAKMHYSSTAHLSNQFKKITGLTPTSFKSLTVQRRSNLEDL